MALTKLQKQKIIEELKEKIAKQKAIIFIDFTGLKVKDLFELRRKLKTEGCELKITKKTLMAIAFQKAKMEIQTKNLSGQVALIFGYKDEISPAKIAWQFSEKNPNLKILTGILENQLVEKERILELAKLPAREELLTKLVANLSAPISSFINVLQANIKGLINVLAQAKT